MIRIARHIALVAAVLLLASCDNSIDPFVRSDNRAFAIFGYLDTSADTQFVRVSAIRPEGDTPSTGEPPFIVSRHLTTGGQTVWADSIVTVDDGSSARFYHAAFLPDPGAAYVLEVRSGDSSPLRAFTQVPSRPTVQFETPRLSGEDVTQRVVWQDVPEPSLVRVTYHLQVGDHRRAARVEIEYDERFYASPDDRVEVLIPYHRDYGLVRQEIDERFSGEAVRLDRLEMNVRSLSSEWSQSSRGTNIENGEGFFASVGEFTETWAIADSLAHHIGFIIEP